MSGLCLVTVPGLDVRLHWRDVWDRLLDEFPAVSDVLATTMPGTLLIVHDGGPDSAWIDIAAAIHSRRERELHSVVASGYAPHHAAHQALVRTPRPA